MVCPPDFSLSGLFGCHVAWPNMGGNLFVWFRGARIFRGEFSPPKVPPMSGPTPGPIRLPHGARRRLLGGPSVNFYFACYDVLTGHTNRCCCRPACPVFKTACITTSQTCIPIWTLKQPPPPPQPQNLVVHKAKIFLFLLLLAGHCPTSAPLLKRNPWSPGGATNPCGCQWG